MTYIWVRRASRLKRSPLSLLGLAIVIAWGFIAILAPFISPYDPMEIDLGRRLLPPSTNHPLGTDFYGRDVLSRIIYGARYDIIIAILAVMFAAGIGTPIGVIAGYYGGRIDEIIMRLADVIMAFPSLVLAMALAAVLGPGLEKAIFVLAFVGTAGYARLARGSTLLVKEESYVEAAKAIGGSDPWTLFKHIFPNVISPIIVRGTLGMGFTVLLAASLSFIGLGIRPPTPEWGAIINEGRLHLVTGKWWITTFAGLAIMTLVLGFNLLGDGIRDILDPREFTKKRA